MKSLHTPTIQHLYNNIFPSLTHSAIQLYLYYHLQSQNHTNSYTLDLLKFCQETNMSHRTAYRALNILKENELIPRNTTFINTYDPEKQP